MNYSQYEVLEYKIFFDFTQKKLELELLFYAQGLMHPVPEESKGQKSVLPEESKDHKYVLQEEPKGLSKIILRQILS